MSYPFQPGDPRFDGADAYEAYMKQKQSSPWQPIDSAPRDGTQVDLWLNGSRVADAYWGKPDHECGEAGQYCDCCPDHDGWCDMFGYLEDEYGHEPTHWMHKPAGPH